MAFNPTLKHLTTRLDGGVIWTASTEYLADNIVIFQNASYRCLINHTSSASFVTDLNSNRWVKLNDEINYILNGNALVDTSGWSTYLEPSAVTFQDAGDTVTLNNHGFANGTVVSFLSITSTTGININTPYYVISATTNTFQLSSSPGGSALALTTNGSGVLDLKAPYRGTGGSPNVTFTRSTTTPLRGIADFNFAKDAANRQGQGVSTDFTIDSADQAKVLTVTFDYEVLSGTYADGDLTVYLIADPSGTPVVIQPAGYTIQSATSGTKMREIATFQTQASGQSYRLCLHVASTSAQAYTIAIDNVSVSPQKVVYGSPVTDWVSYTPTLGGVGTATGVSFKYRRIGDSISVVGTFVTGTPTASSFTISLPFSIDSTKAINASPAGMVIRGAASFQGSAIILRTDLSTSVVYSGGQWTAVQLGLTPQNGSVLFPSGETVSVEFFYPAAGLSSSVQMSNDTDTRVVSFQASTSAATSVTSSDTLIPFATVAQDTHGAWNGSDTYTVPVSGTYRVSVKLATNAGAFIANNGSLIYIYKNGVSNKAVAEWAAGSSTTLGVLMSGSTTLTCNAGDTIKIYAVSATTVSLNGLTSRNYVSIERLSGPATIAASESVQAQYWASANGTVNATTPINFDSRAYDSHSAVTTGAAWKFTAPISGKYQLNVFLYPNGAPGSSVLVVVYKNGSIFNSFGYVQASVVGSGASSVIVEMNAGEFIDIRTTANYPFFGSATRGNNPCLISISRVGN